MYRYISLILVVFLVGCGEKDASAIDESMIDPESSKQDERINGPDINYKLFETMTKDQLRLTRNTIFAKYGRPFDSQDLVDYFSKQEWYKVNKDFKESDLSDEDARMVKTIKIWEESTQKLWQKHLDLDGDGAKEYCYVLYNESSKKFNLIVNTYSKERPYYWKSDADIDTPPADWIQLHVDVVDINANDKRKEIHIHQRFNQWVDPGTENLIGIYDGTLTTKILSSTNYDSGVLTFDNKGHVTMQFSNCPEHTQTFTLTGQELKKTGEDISPEPGTGCAACFVENSLVATNQTETKTIQFLVAGDSVLSYDTKSGEYFTTTVKRVLAVHHNNLQTFILGETTVTATEDHPFWVANKGWCSRNPSQTIARYSNYESVQLLEIGDTIQLVSGAESTLEKIAEAQSGMTFTIAELEQGNTFIVNGLIVGTESPAQKNP